MHFTINKFFSILIIFTVFAIQTPKSIRAQVLFQRPSQLFHLPCLSGWDQDLSPKETLPYNSEKIKSPFLWGARSSFGSFAFVTITDNTVLRQALTVDVLSSLVREGSFSHLLPSDLKKKIETINLNLIGKNKKVPLKIFSLTIKAKQFTYHLQGHDSSLMILKKIYFPVALKRGKEYFNYLIIANFRGKSTSSHDLNAFNSFYKSFRISLDNFEYVDVDHFNVIQPGIAEIMKSAHNNHNLDVLPEIKNIETNNLKNKPIELKSQITPFDKPPPIIDIYQPSTDKIHKELKMKVSEIQKQLDQMVELINNNNL